MGTFSSLWFFVGFVGGTLTSQVVCRITDSVRNRRDGGHRHTRVKATWAAGGLLVAFMLYSVVSTYQSGRVATAAQATAAQTAEEARALTAANGECSRQFNEALSRRAEINAEDTKLQREADALSATQRDALADAVAGLLAGDDAAVEDALDRIRVAQADEAQLKIEQANVDAQRANHPYPEPTCGR